MDLSNGKDEHVSCDPAPMSRPNQSPKSNVHCTKDDANELNSRVIPENGETNSADQMAVDVAVMETVLQYLEKNNIYPDRLTDDELTWYIKYVIDNVPYQLRSNSVESQVSGESCRSR